MRFRFDIKARRRGAIGWPDRFIVERGGADRDAAQLALYDEYEHIEVIGVELLAE